MGGIKYSDSVHVARLASNIKSSGSRFVHDSNIRSKKVEAKVHEKLDPSKVNGAGIIIRESRDSEVHPNSLGIVVGIDVTGSQRKVPGIVVEQLKKLMGILIKKGYVENPHVLFAAIGDATSDKVPLQVGQFEGGADEMDDALTNIYLEGNGGSQRTESYELFMYFMAKYAVMDCLEKRGKKAYLFLTGDELPYKEVNKDQVERIIGDGLQCNIPTPEILEELRNKFEVFWIMPGGTSYFNVENINESLRDMFGQNFIKMENPNDICEVIATAIGINEGYDINKIKSDLKDIGSDDESISRVSKSLVSYQGGLVKKGKSSSVLVSAGADDVVRV